MKRVSSGLVGILFMGASAALAQSPTGKGTWSDLATMPSIQVESGATLLDGKIYMFGGWKDEGAPFKLVQIYDIAKNSWSDGPPMPEAVHHEGVVTTGGKIYIVGGFTEPFPKREPTDHVWAFDPATGKWERRAPLPSPRGAGVAAALNGLIYYAGGEHRRAPGGPPAPPGAPAAYEPVADLTVYDPATDVWKALAPMKVRRDHAYGGALNGHFVVMGGRDRPVYNLDANEDFDPASGAWTQRAPMPTGRSGGYGATLNARFFAFGGEGNPAVPSGVYPQVEAFDPATNSWTKYADMPLPRHSLVALAQGRKIYLPGGATKRGGGEVTDKASVFEPE